MELFFKEWQTLVNFELLSPQSMMKLFVEQKDANLEVYEEPQAQSNITTILCFCGVAVVILGLAALGSVIFKNHKEKIMEFLIK